MEAVGAAPVRARFSKTPRSAAEIEHHYRVEIELAERLRSAPRDERLGLYGAVYDELYRRVPSHPQLVRKVSDAERRAGVADRISLLRRFIDLNTVFLEIGAGDGSLPLEVARHARKCYALDVSKEILSGVQHARVETVLSDGCSVPVPANSVTLAYSFQVMEHIHPDDALEQLRNLFAVIAPGRLLHLRDAQPSQRTARRVEVLRPGGAWISSQGIHERGTGSPVPGRGIS